MPTSACAEVPFFAITTRGLEDVSAAEVSSLQCVRLLDSGYRRIDGFCAGDVTPLLSLRTVDDVYVLVWTRGDITHQRSALRLLTALSTELALERGTRTVSSVRAIPIRPHFSVTASFVGKRNYTTEEVKHAVAIGVMQALPHWSYVEDDRQAHLNLRLFVEHERAWVGIRLAKDPLRQRSYKIANVPGSLKAPVAAALVWLAGAEGHRAQPRMSLLDPFCGAGTILAEAGLMGFKALGGDVLGEALDAARENLSRASVSAPVEQWDAQRLPLMDHSIDRVVTNMPWGRQIRTDSALAQLYRVSFSEMLRVLAPDGRMVALTSAPELLAPLSSSLVEQKEISLFGQRPHILVFAP
jgi:23S rRNA G2445 N2-methylase RlmL